MELFLPVSSNLTKANIKNRAPAMLRAEIISRVYLCSLTKVSNYIISNSYINIKFC